MSGNNPSNAVDALCPKCALCCNGVLFGDVELQTADRPETFLNFGLKLQRKGRGNTLRFRQPCPCLDKNLCRIYASRPERCRTFECHVLKRVQAGELTTEAALKIITRARRRSGRVLKIIRALGNQDEHLPLNQRYARIMREPMDLAGDESVIELRSKLMLAVHELAQTIGAEFLAS